MITSSFSFGREENRAYHLVGVIQWALPLALFAVSGTYEIAEHVLIEGRVQSNVFFTGEVLFFGIAGPLAVAVVLAYIRRLLGVQLEARLRVEQVNRDLEVIVAERTGHLQEAKRDLEAKNEALAQANAELRQLDQMKSDFVGLVSHALRAPLTNLSGALELIAPDLNTLPEPVQRTLHVLGQESARLHTLVKTILDISHLEAGKLNLNRGPVALEPLLARTAKAILSTRPERPLFLAMPRGIPPVWADEIYLEEVVSNLLSNAVKYSPEGMPVHIAASVEGNTVAVSIIDHGPGVPPGDRAKIFEVFHRTPVGERADPSGRGLGLYFAQKLIQAHGGRIWVEGPIWPDPAQPGVRFTFTLPVVDAVPGEEECER